MADDIKTKEEWAMLLDNPDVASTYERNLVNAVKAADAVELLRLMAHMPALALAGNEWQIKEYSSVRPSADRPIIKL